MRWGLLLAALGLMGALTVVAVRALRPEWRQVQVGLSALEPDVDVEPGIHQVIDCSGSEDRCATCHPRTHQPHPPGPPCRADARLGCGTCHGGEPRALTARVAHALPGGSGTDPLMKAPHVQAACGRCHLPGAVAGTERLAAGAQRFLQLGCPVCHPLESGGKGGAAFGPNLRATGRLTLRYLTDSLVNPTANFAGSSMPSFERTLTDHPEVLTDLLIYLQALALEPLPGCAPAKGIAGLVDRPCADCHAGTGGRATGRLQHGCIYLKERVSGLNCAGCHPGDVPAAGSGNGFCPVVRQHRPACVACHPSSRSNPRSVD